MAKKLLKTRRRPIRPVCLQVWGLGLGHGWNLPSNQVWTSPFRAPLNRQTDTTEIITFPQTTYAGGNEVKTLLVPVAMAEDRWWRRHRNRRTRRTIGPWRYPCRRLFPSNWRTPRPTSRGGCLEEPRVGYISECLKNSNFDMQWDQIIKLIFFFGYNLLRVICFGYNAVHFLLPLCNTSYDIIYKYYCLFQLAVVDENTLRINWLPTVRATRREKAIVIFKVTMRNVIVTNPWSWSEQGQSRLFRTNQGRTVCIL